MSYTSSQTLKVFFFMIYSVLYELIIWSTFLFLIVILNWSAWTILLAILMSGAQLKAKSFDINCKSKQSKHPKKESNEPKKEYNELNK